MFKILSNKIGIWCGVLLWIGGYFYAGEDVQDIETIKVVYHEHYKPFKKSVLNQRLKVNNTPDCVIKLGASLTEKYDDFVVNTCIPASYSFFGRDPKDVKRILKKIGSDDMIISHMSVLFDKCKNNPNDKNFVAHITYDEGKRIEQERIKQGYIISAEDRDTWTAIGLFAKYVMIDKKISF